jgi:serine/threonine protein kinase/formylglycine-generating enzyme required for sulfatase activity
MHDSAKTHDYRARGARAVDPAPAQPTFIGRYRVERLLGFGGFGLVYLAHDDQLGRPIAIKVPHRTLVSRPEDAELYKVEARTVASLDHPNIVPVYDVGSTEDFPCFIVSKFIEGGALTQKIRSDRLSINQATELVATIAEALHHAHRAGLVHRDIKPGNILLDTSGKPFVVDFGLALREENIGKGPKCVGTPAYMSPEQARGEGHRVDGRSDIFSLGVVFYELLVGRPPFRAETRAEYLEQIASFEPRPPRQYDDGIAKELDRICLKALSKRATDRYSTAQDMADDLRHFLTQQTMRQQSGPNAQGGASRSEVGVAHSIAYASGQSALHSATLRSVPGLALKIVPKGLRSFDAHDADSFLELLPGPRNRDGLPESIRFWKTRIEETDNEKTFAVGVICGPSGCGKSSLVKAGLLPRLPGDVLSVYLEATALETEVRLLNGLRKRCPDLPTDLGLNETLAALRRGQGLPAGKKLLIVIDQFEQWLHANKEKEKADLVQALRQADGGRVQCIVMVRDDFWMALIRFTRDLEVLLLEGQNSATVDLFDINHAGAVLAAFGRAFGKLPESARDLDKQQKDFLKQAVAGLAQEGKVISVRLALFAEMMKSKTWTPDSLRAVGGTEGVGVTFLDETFSTAAAPPEHRYHQRAARAVLKALLPQAGTDIKGHMQSRQSLLEASGYADRPKDFDDLIRILDSEIRLITPTDSESMTSPTTEPALTTRYYQLTHDYLVRPLRAWLTRKQKETRRGRAELLLADRAAVWNARPENRQLPSLVQWFQINWLTARQSWTEPQRKMMHKAARYHGLCACLAAVVLALVAWGADEGHGRLQARALRDRLLDANTNQVPTIVEDMAPYRRWLDPLLHDPHALDEMDKLLRRKQLHISLALLPVDASQVDYLYERLLEAEPGEIPVIREALAPHQTQLVDKLWAVVEAPAPGKEAQRLRAAAALAKYDPSGPRWKQVEDQVVSSLVGVQLFHLKSWVEALSPVRTALVGSLSNVHRDHDAKRDPSKRTFATNILAVYAADMPQLLADLLMDSDEQQFPYLYPKLTEHGQTAATLLHDELAKRHDGDATPQAREKLMKRQANAAVAILRMGQPATVRPMLKHSADPALRSLLTDRLGPLGADLNEIIQLLLAESDLEIRRALISSLGEFTNTQLPRLERSALIERLFEVFTEDSDAGIHAAAECLLRSWGEDRRLKGVTDKLRAGEAQLGYQAKTQAKANGPRWHVNAEGQTMVVMAGPMQFLMGSLPETAHLVRINRTFAIGAKQVTVAEYRRKHKDHPMTASKPGFELECPVVFVSWYQAAAYCNWLSKEMGIDPDEWCFETDGQGKVTGLKKNYLSLTGYRLPTEAEMEYATRAGASTSRSYGDSEELLVKYGWIVPNCAGHLGPVGRLKPNDFGLFDMHGNVWCWCLEARRDFPRGEQGQVFEDQEFEETFNPQQERVLRGNCYTDHAANVHSSARWSRGPERDTNIIGFRLARTIAKK